MRMGQAGGAWGMGHRAGGRYLPRAFGATLATCPEWRYASAEQRAAQPGSPAMGCQAYPREGFMSGLVSSRVRPSAFSALQKALHWLIALMVVVLVPVGFIMAERGEKGNFDAVTAQMYLMHKSFGFLLLLLMVLRIGVRLRHGTPAPEPGLSRWQRIAAEAVHGLLYLLLLGVAVIGWLGVSAFDARGVLGGMQLPALLAKNESLAKILFEIHGVLALLIVALVAVHIGAALYHHFILKDGVLRRMLPSKRAE